MSIKNNLGVALVKELCPICCKEIDGPIIMNRVLTEEYANNIKNMHGKVIGFADHCCEECAKYKDEAVFFIGIDESKCSSRHLKDLYRTGQIVAIKKESKITDYFDDFLITLQDGAKVVFLDEKVGKELEIFKENA